MGLRGLSLACPQARGAASEGQPARGVETTACGWQPFLTGTGWLIRYSYQPEAKIRPSRLIAQVCLVSCSPVSGLRKT